MSTEDKVLVNDWHIVALYNNVLSDKPLSVTLLGENIVLWRSKGEIIAWRDVCIHRGARLSLGKVDDQCIVCPYHGWGFDAEGVCIKIPAQAQSIKQTVRPTAYNVLERYGYVWVCLGEPENQPCLFPEWDDFNYRKIHCGPYSFNTYGERAMENFLDVTHLPFIHDGILGDPYHTVIEDFEVESSSDGISTSPIKVWQPNPDGRSNGSYVLYSYAVLRAFSARFTKQFGEGDKDKFTILFNVTPTELGKCLVWMIIAINFETHQTDQDIRDFQDNIIVQDIAVVQTQTPDLVPLNFKSEMLIASDKAIVAYRRWLRQINLSYGLETKNAHAL